jgi:hypothetical protein
MITNIICVYENFTMKPTICRINIFQPKNSTIRGTIGFWDPFSLEKTFVL